VFYRKCNFCNAWISSAFVFVDFFSIFYVTFFSFAYVYCYAATPFCNSVNLMAFVPVFQCNPSYELMLRCAELFRYELL